MREFVNSETNHLGMPLPEGNLRFYLRDTNGQLEFTAKFGSWSISIAD